MKRLIPAVMVLLAVIMCADPLPAQERFIDNGDGTVTDVHLKIMWGKEDSKADISWKDAERWIKFSFPTNIGSRFDNWRMPRPDELETLFVREATPKKCACGREIRVAPPVTLSCAWVWTSEVRSIAAVVFNFQRGHPFTDRMVHEKHYRALPVRDLSPEEIERLH